MWEVKSVGWTRQKSSDLVDVDRKLVTLLTAYRMWSLLWGENLTSILHENSPLPEMALRAMSILKGMESDEYPERRKSCKVLVR